MGPLRLVLRGLRHHWRQTWPVCACGALATAVVTGALMVGDSVDHSLGSLAEQRLGGVEIAVRAHQQPFTADLGRRLATQTGADVAAVLALDGVASCLDGRTAPARVLGIADDLAALLPGAGFEAPTEGEVVLGEELAARLGVVVGDDVALRVPRPSGMPMEAPLGRGAVDLAVLRARVSAVVTADQGGALHLDADQRLPFNAFVARDELAAQVGGGARANLLLVGSSGGDPVEVEAALKRAWTLDDAGLQLRNGNELISPGIFLSDAVADAASVEELAPLFVSSYLADTIAAGGREVPYSIVTGIGDRAGVSPVPGLLGDDDLALDRWTADDLGADVGDEVTLRYRTLGPSGALLGHERSFRVAVILPMEGLAIDGDLMPPFPGLGDAASCSSWDPGFDIDLDRIRPADEAYWESYRGAPKAFVGSSAARDMWANRYGAITAIRFEGPSPPPEALERAILHDLIPGDVGIAVVPVRQQARAAVEQASDFGGLVLGFSFFLVAAALMLVGLLFALMLDRRKQDAGVLLALGFTPARVRALLLAEGAILAAAGAAAGAAVGPLYALVMILGLDPVWPGAHVAPALDLTWSGPTVGFVSGTLTALATMTFVVFRTTWTPPGRLLPQETPGRGSWRAAVVAWVLALGALAGTAALVAVAPPAGGHAAAGFFMGAGFLVLTGGVLALYGALRVPHRVPRWGARVMAWRNLARSRGRSLVVVSLVALCSFLVVAVEAYRRDPQLDAGIRASGTGGFGLWGESVLPLPTVDDPRVLGLRVRDGDEASCRNLNRPQQPRVLGVPTRELSDRGAFALLGSDEDPWALLEDPLPDGTVPALADQNTLVWSLGLGLGDEITIPDGAGEPVTLRLVGVLSASILQGAVLVSVADFAALYPHEAGFRAFLVDAPTAGREEIAAALGRDFGSAGFHATDAVVRLAEFHSVENTYLTLFQALAGLALLLGTAGIGVVLLTTVAQRRKELAVLRAMGFTRARVVRGLLLEHLGLLTAGLAIGLAAALVATGPLTLDPQGGFPTVAFTATLAGVTLVGTAWTGLAASLAMRGNPRDILEEET